MTMNERSPRRILVYEFISAGGLGDQLSTPMHADGEGRPGESLLLQGMTMRDAIVEDLLASAGLEVCVVDSAAAPWMPQTAQDMHAQRCKAVRAAPGESPEAFLARASPGFDRVWVIAPETSNILAGLCRIVGPARWTGCDAVAIELCSSKSATREHLARHSIATPTGWLPDDGSPRAGTRWIVKPDDGAGTQDTRRHTDLAAARADFDARRAAAKPATLERWVDGEAISLSLLCGGDGAELLCVNRQRIHVAHDGTLSYHGVQTDVETRGSGRWHNLTALARAIHAAIPGLAGFVGIDLIWTPDGQAVVIEINPRPTCAYVGLSRRLGRNLGTEILAIQDTMPTSSPAVRASESTATERAA